MTLIDKAEAHDDDLIRRGDALAAVKAYDFRWEAADAIAALPPAKQEHVADSNARVAGVPTEEDREWIDARADELFRANERIRGSVRPSTIRPQDFRDYFVVNATLERFAAIPARGVGVPESVIRQAVLEWIKKDTGTAVKMSVTLGQVNALIARVMAVLEPTTAQPHPDDAAVDRFAAAMKEKLAQARAKGRGGWDDPAQCSVEFLAALLIGHIGKRNAGNFEDIANLAMMLHQRGADPSILAALKGDDHE